jgi:hypothetical protein
MHLRVRAAALIVSAITMLTVGAGGAGAITWSAPEPVVTAPPYSIPGVAAGVSCPSVHLCVAVDTYGDVLTSTAPSAGGWSRAKVLTGRLDFIGETSTRAFASVACPSVGLCVASDNHGDLVTSHDPTGGASAWRVERPRALHGTQAGALACPSTRLCVAALANGRLAVSTRPLGPAGAWSRVGLNRQHVTSSAISCPSRHLCVVSAAGGSVAVTLGRAGRPGRVQRAPGPRLQSLSCPTTALCVGLTQSSRVGFVRHPDRSGAQWKTTSARYASFALENSIDCLSAKLCLAGVTSPRDVLEVVVSTRPTGGAKTWVPVKTAPAPTELSLTMRALTCPSSRLCVGLDNQGEAFSSSRPSRHSQPWTVAGADGVSPLNAVACGSAAACVAVGNGIAVATADPAGPATSWREAPADVGNAVACPDANLCVASDASGDIATSGDPLAPTPSWTAGVVIPSGFEQCPRDISCSSQTVNHLACPSASLCLGFGVDSTPFGGPYSSSSTSPAAGAPAWTTDATPSFDGGAVACPAASLCVAVGRGTAGGGYIGTSTTPADGGSWTSAPVDARGATLTGIACPTTTLCEAVDDQGNLLSSTDPTSPATWVRTAIDPGHALAGVACGSAALCVAVDDRGTALQSTTPAGGAGTWSAASVISGDDLAQQPIQLLGAACPSAQLCLLTDSAGDVIVGRA